MGCRVSPAPGGEAKDVGLSTHTEDELMEFPVIVVNNETKSNILLV
jgi:hypothetical protein